MKFSLILKEVVWLLVTEGRVSYRRLAREFDLDVATLEDLLFELIEVQRLAVDRDGQVLVWLPAAQVDGETRMAGLPHPMRLVEGTEPPSTGPHEASVASIAAAVMTRTAAMASPAGMPPPAAMPGPDLIEAEQASPSSVAVEQTRAFSDAERRPLTVMFCDLADSTALSTKLDPEDLQDVIRAYQKRSTDIIREYEGFVAKYMGDGILVYFGYPQSLERNAERAIRSGLAIVEAMAQLNQTLGRADGTDLSVRIGIATGLVVVGEIVGEGLAQERTVIGEAPNVAARLQAVAGHNGIVIGSLTKEIAGDAFVYEDLGARPVKGVAGLVKTWGVLGLRDEHSEEEEQTDGDDRAPEPLIGRDEESGLLRRAWQSTKAEGRGQVVTLSGEAGIGKSVLVDGLRAEVRAEGLPRIAFGCSPYHSGSALHPVIEHLRRLAGWQPEDSAGARLAALEAMLAGTSQPLAEMVPLFASLLSLAVPEERYPALKLTPQQQRDQTQDALIAWLLEEAERQPILTVWEDLHWADPSTLELLGLLIEQVPTAPLMMVLTFRPDFVPPWPARSHVTPITLNRLERVHSEALVARIAGTKALPGEVVEHVVIKTDGVPLYVEELTKTILASDILRDTGERFELVGPLSTLSIPETLQESLMARLDRLPQVREIAQLGAVLGREFAFEMITGLSNIGEATVQEGLEQLVEAELLYQRGRPPRAKYIFKHALIQDAAYQSILKRTRHNAHRQVAELLASKFPEVVEAQPELLARHYTEAGSTTEAAKYWQLAGEKAVQRSANPEAIAHLSEGLNIVRAMPEDQARAHRELNLLTTIGPALIATKGYAAPEVGATYRRAVDLCSVLGEMPQQFSALHGLWFFHYIRAELDAARSLAEQLVDLAKARNDPGLDLAAHRSLGYTLNSLGEFDAARSCLDRVITSYDPSVHGSYAFRHGGADPCVGSLSLGSWTVWALGYPDQALAQVQKGLALARELQHPFSEAWSLIFAAALHNLRGRREATLEHAELAAAIAGERGFALYLGWTQVLRGCSLDDETGAVAIAEIREGLEASRETGAGLFTPYWLALLASTHGRIGQVDEGLLAVTEALAGVAHTGERFWEAELYRLQGQLLREGDAGNVAEIETCFQRAIEIARSQNAKSWELRAGTSLARLWRDHGKTEEAREFLTPIYGWFTEGFDTADLRDAKALLDRLY